MIATQVSDDDPEDRCTYLSYLGLAWYKLFIGGAVLSIGFSALLEGIDGSRGKTAGVHVLVFVGVFCIAGMADGFWRVLLASAARRRFRQHSRTMDDVARHLMKLARANDVAPLLQVGVATLFTTRIF